MPKKSGLTGIDYNIAPACLPERTDFVRGDTTGLSIPAHPETLAEAGTEFLTAAFRAFGALDPQNNVACITKMEACPGGSTGSKLFLSVEYARPDAALHKDLDVPPWFPPAGIRVRPLCCA